MGRTPDVDINLLPHFCSSQSIAFLRILIICSENTSAFALINTRPRRPPSQAAFVFKLQRQAAPQVNRFRHI
jgi:hypothetical protein